MPKASAVPAVPVDPAPPLDLAALTERLGDDLVTLDKELAEVDLLISQAKAEAVRHETRRTAGADKLAALGPDSDPTERVEVAVAQVTLTKRAALMETQVDVLEGKRRALARYRDAVALYLESIRGIGGLGVPTAADAPMAPAVSRLIVDAQENLRREIARAMHDGPAQSLTNIVLQAQIVERLVERDPASAAGEVRLLTSMVQQTLDATKSFIFDVRPMVLDDLGLVPTIRRTIRERSRRAGTPVVFDTLGQDRRLPMDLESGLFRMLDEALAAYLAARPDNVTVRLDWGEEQLEAVVRATRAVVEEVPDRDAVPTPDQEGDKDLPPALAMMLEERRATERDAADAAVRAAIVTLPTGVWREIQGRASSTGVTAELLEEGAQVRLVAPLPALIAAPETDQAEG
jgi:two-component system sensor histidine kinase DegS